MSERSPSPQRAAYLRAQRHRRRLVLALQILLLVAFLGLWELSARLGWVDAFIVSSPSRVVHTLVGLQTSGELWLHIGTSCLEVVCSTRIWSCSTRCRKRRSARCSSSGSARAQSRSSP